VDPHSGSAGRLARPSAEVRADPTAYPQGVFKSIADLQAGINRYLNERNADPKPFASTKPAKHILAKIQRLPVPSV
jgi:hypothetical protein